MKKHLTFVILTVLIQSFVLTGCTNQNSAQQLPPTKAEDKAQLPQAEASGKDSSGSNKNVILGFCTDAGKNSRNSLLNNLHTLHEVVFFWYTFDKTGKIIRTENADLSLKDAAQKSGKKVYALIHNLNGEGFNSQTAHQVLVNPNVRRQLIHNLDNLVESENWDGISIDIEKTLPTDRDQYSTFISELHAVLEKQGKNLNVCIPAKYQDYKNDLWSGAYDYRAIGKNADQVVLMTYEEHGTGTTQGPVASQGWVNRVIKFAASEIPPQKTIMGLPVYANEWISSKPMLAKAMSIPQATGLARQHNVAILYDESQQVPHYTFTVTGIRHEVYLENARSLNYKLNIAEENSLLGVAVWRLGLEDPVIWKDVLKGYSAYHK